MKIKPHFLTSYYNLPSNIWILAIPTVRIIISLIFQYSFIEYLRQIWIDALLLSSVFLYAYFKYKLLDITITSDLLTIESGVFIRSKREVSLSKVELIEVTKNPISSLFKSRKLKLYINTPPRGRPFLCIIVNDSEIMKMGIKKPAGEIYKSEIIDLLKYSIIETNPLTGIFLAYSLVSIVSDIVGTDYSVYFTDGVSVVSSLVAVFVPPFVAAILSIVALGYLISLISFLSTLYSFKENKDSEILNFKYGFIFKNRVTTSESAIACKSGKCGFFGALFSVWGDGYNIRTTRKRLLKIDSTPPQKTGIRPSLWGIYLYLRAPLILMGVILLCYIIISFFSLALFQIENILFISAIFSVYFLAQRILLFVKSRLSIDSSEVTVVSGRFLSFDYRNIERAHIYRIKEGSSPFMRQKEFYNYEIYIDGTKPAYLYAMKKKELSEMIKESSL